MKPAAARRAAKPQAVQRTRRAAKAVARPAVKPAPRSASKSDNKLTVRPALIARAKTLGINATKIAEQAIEAAITEAEQAAEPYEEPLTEAARRWYAANKEAVDAHNAFVAKHGVFGEEFREF